MPTPKPRHGDCQLTWGRPFANSHIAPSGPRPIFRWGAGSHDRNRLARRRCVRLARKIKQYLDAKDIGRVGDLSTFLPDGDSHAGQDDPRVRGRRYSGCTGASSGVSAFRQHDFAVGRKNDCFWPQPARRCVPVRRNQRKRPNSFVQKIGLPWRQIQHLRSVPGRVCCRPRRTTRLF